MLLFVSLYLLHQQQRRWK